MNSQIAKRSIVVVFGDNGRAYSDPIIKKFGEEANLIVLPCKNATEVLGNFDTEPDVHFWSDILITDGRLDHGDKFSDEETDGGLTTGTSLYMKLREIEQTKGIDPQYSTPVIIFTTDPEEFQVLQELSHKDSDPRLVAIRAGTDTTELVTRAIKKFFPEVEISSAIEV